MFSKNVIHCPKIDKAIPLFGRSTIKRSLSDGNILCENDAPIRNLNATDCQHSSEKPDKQCLLESNPDILTCGSAICHCRYA